MGVKDRLWVATFVVMAVLLTANVMADWPEEIDSGNYSGSMTQVYTDVMKPQAVLQGAVSDTNISATADIDGSKLEDSTLSFSKNFYASAYFAGKPGDSSRKYCYGDAKIAVDSIVPGGRHDLKIHFSDSSDCGNPAFGSAPKVLVSYYAIRDTLTIDSHFIALDSLAAYPIVWVRRGGGGGARCSVTVHNPTADTLWTRHARIDWQAMEDAD